MLNISFPVYSKAASSVAGIFPTLLVNKKETLFLFFPSIPQFSTNIMAILGSFQMSDAALVF